MSASKREELVKGALKAFCSGGFHAIGMDRLAKETGVSKTAIYKHFRTKEELILAALRLRDEQYRNWMMRRVETLADNPRGQLLAVFDALGEWFLEPGFKGCTFIKASSEYLDRDDPIHSTAAEHSRLLRSYLKGLSSKAGAPEPEVLARELLVIVEGAIVLAHLLDPVQASSDARRTAHTVITEHLRRVAA